MELIDEMLVVPDACSFSPANGRGTVVLELPAAGGGAVIEALQSRAAVDKALGYAGTHGIGDPRLNGMTRQAYPLNSDKQVLDQVFDVNGKQLPSSHPKMRPAFYRVDVEVCSKLL